jgi:hypothetical protein
MAYFRERSDRQLFMLRAELKSQYRTAQDAQVQERRAEDMKKRFMSYSESDAHQQDVHLTFQSFMKCACHSTRHGLRLPTWTVKVPSS